MRFLKNIKGQAGVEFALAVPIVLFLTLGVFDIAKANIIKMENQLTMQSFVSVLASNHDKSIAELSGQAARYLQDTSFFCSKVSSMNGGGSGGAASCSNPVQVTLRVEKADTTSPNKVPAGTQVCIAAKAVFKPTYSGIYGKNNMTVYSRSCSLMETSLDQGGFLPIARGTW